MAAGTSIFTLMGEIFIDNDKANESIQKTETRAEKLGKGLQKGIGTAAKWGAALGAAAVGAGAAMFAMANKSADALDEIHKGSQRMGVSTKAYQEMEYWASQNGLSHSDMEKAVGRLNQRIGEAKAGNDKYSNALEKLGVNMDDVRAGTVSTEDAFAKSIQSLSEMTNEQDKAALASELFGTKLSRELLPALNDGSLSFEEAQKKAEELGIVLSEDSVNAGAKFKDTMDDIKRSMGSVVTNIGSEVMPVFQKGLDWVVEHMPQIQETVKVVFKKIGEFVTISADIFKDYLLPVFMSIFEWTKENWPTIQKIIEGVFKAIQFVWDNVLEPTLSFLWNMLKSIVEWAGINWPIIQSKFETVFNAIKFVWDEILAPVLDFLWQALKKVVDFVTERFEGMQTIVENTFSGIGKAVEVVIGIFERVTSAIKTAYDWLTKWNNTDAKDNSPRNTPSQYSYDGSHAGGLDRVPFDGYKAILHKDEGVLTAKENKAYKSGKGGSIINQNITINSPTALRPSETARRIKNASRELAMEV